MLTIPIHHTFAPHATLAYWWQSFKLLFMPWQWRRGSASQQLKQALHQEYGAQAHLFATGRQALLALLKALNLEPGSEVILQGFTCMVLPNAIRAAGLTPKYCDIDRDTLNLDPTKLRESITPQTKVIIAQHTFGIQAPTKAIKEICAAHNLILIEDYAHSVPPPAAKVEGSFWLLSFGRDKGLSGITGGAIMSSDGVVSTALVESERLAQPLGWFTVKRLLLYPSLYWDARCLMGVKLGFAYLKLMRSLTLLLPILSSAEKGGKMNAELKQMPNACAKLALWSFKRRAQLIEQRQILTGSFKRLATEHNLAFPSTITGTEALQKFALFINKADEVRRRLKAHNIHLEDGWTGVVVCPRSCNQAAAHYRPGTCPVAEEVSQKMLCLPTHQLMRPHHARYLVNTLKSCL